MIPGERDIQYMPRSSRIISEILHVPEIDTLEKCDFLRSLIHSKKLILCFVCKLMDTFPKEAILIVSLCTPFLHRSTRKQNQLLPQRKFFLSNRIR